MISQAGSLVLHVDNPQVILDAIATARLREVNGKQLLVIPHRADEVRVLKNLGLEPPAIKLNGFQYTGRFKPFDHQKKTVEFLIVNKKAFNLSDMGTGKTAAALWASEYLRQKGYIRRILIVCPLSVISVWEEECWNIVPHRSFCRILGTKEKRISLLNKKSDICVINHDGLTIFGKTIRKGDRAVVTLDPAIENAGFDLIVLDEASAYRNSQTNRYKIFRKIARKSQWLWPQTGTPAPKAPTDAFGLIKLVDPDAFPGGFGLFKELTMFKVSAFKWIPRADSKELVYKYLRPAIRFKKADCLDLPPLTYVSRACELSEQQNKAFLLMKQKMIMEQHTGEKITAANAAVKLLKLIQICCGVVKDNQGVHYKLDCSKRLEVLEETVEESGGKCIIFVPFIGVMEMVEGFLKRAGYKTGLVNGDVSFTARTKIFDEFQNGDSNCLIAHSKTAAHGLNLTAAATVIWYAPIFSVEQYLQANERVNRPGQTKAMTVVHLIATPLEAGLYRALWQRITLQQAILEQYEQLMR